MASTDKIRHETNHRRRGTEHLAAVPISKSGLPHKNVLLVCLFLAAISLVVYSRSLFNDFINCDDREYITENKHIQAGLTVESVEWAFTTFRAGNWHPLTWISHALDVQIFGLAPSGHHVVSMIFHVLNVMLLFLLLWRATGYCGRSLAIAALFAVHPLNVEVVAWAAERKTLLSTLLFFLALSAYGWYARRPSVSRYGVLAFLFALALMSKPMVITLPFVLLLLDYWPLQRIESWTAPREPWVASRKPALSLLLEKLPLLLLSGASAAITLAAQSQAVVPLSVIPPLWRVENAIAAYARYLIKAALPIGLAPFYPNGTAPKLVEAFFAFMFLVAISTWVWRERKQRPYLITGWLWYLGTMVPVIGFVQVGAQAMADRYAYTPMIGIFVLLVWRAADAQDAHAYPLRQRVALAAAIFLGLASLTWRQVGFWQNSVALWKQTLRVTQDNALAEDRLGTALIELGRDNEAITHFSDAIRLNPTEPKAHMALGMLLQKRGDTRQAIEQYQSALSLTHDPQDLLALYTDLGVAYRQATDYAAASRSFQQVLQLDPANAGAMSALGGVVLRQSATKLEQDLSLHPTADGFSKLGSIWEQAGDGERAKWAYQSALALDAKFPSAENGLERLARHPH